MRYSTYLFDFDGTLVDSMPAFVSTMKRILDENGIAYGDDLVKTITPLGYIGTAKYFISLGLDMSMEEIFDRMQRYILKAYLEEIPAKPYVMETLRTLREKGADLHVLTASPHIALDPCLHRLGMYELFDNVWSCDDFGTTKADPEIYKKAAVKIGKPIEEILFLDDNYNADVTAKKAGMATCGVYDASSAEFEADMRKITDFYICDFRALLAI